MVERVEGVMQETTVGDSGGPAHGCVEKAGEECSVCERELRQLRLRCSTIVARMHAHSCICSYNAQTHTHTRAHAHTHLAKRQTEHLVA